MRARSSANLLLVGVWCAGAAPGCELYSLEDGCGPAADSLCQPHQDMTLPSPPTAVVATAGAASATLSWNSAFGGGAPVSSYSILVTTNGTDAGSGPTTIDAGVVYCLSTSAELTGLVNGFEYVFLVTADNGFGSSSPAASNPVTPASDIPIP